MLADPGPDGAADALWDGVCAVVPAGGAGRRLGGLDKPAVLVGGRSLLGHVLDRLPSRVPVAVVGPERDEPAPDPADARGGPCGRPRTVLACREDPPGGGPAAAVAAGLAALERAGLLGRVVVVVPADAPRAAEVLPRLLAALRRGAPGVTAAAAVEVDPDGTRHRQVLVVAHDAAALRERVAALGDLAGVAAGRLLPRGPELAEVPAPAELLADVDTPGDLAAARALARGARHRGRARPPAGRSGAGLPRVGRMRAVVAREPGGPEVLELRELPDPVPGPGEVLLRVAASGVNRADVAQRGGTYPPPPGASDVLGLEVSGTVLALGRGAEDATDLRVGDGACALLASGGCAELVVVPAGQVMPVPAGVDLVDAAALPEVAATVWSTVFMSAGLRPGEVLLVHGGGSGVGTMAVQLAAQAGAVVAVTAGSERKLRACAELGATVLVDYTARDFVEAVREATGGRGADVVLDVVGGPYLERNVRVLALGGRLVQLGLQGGRKAEIDLGLVMAKRLSVLGSTLRARPVDGPDGKAAICASVVEHVWPLVAEGRVRPVVSERVVVRTADDVARAHADLEAGAHVGKVLLVWETMGR